MGNKELRPLNYNRNDPDLIQFRQLYQRHTVSSKKIFSNNTQEHLEYEVNVWDAFSEVFEKNHYINLSTKSAHVVIDLSRFCNTHTQQMRLLGYSTILNEKKSIGHFVRLKDFIELKAESQKIIILDLSDPTLKFTRKLNPEDKLIVEYHYIIQHQVLQNTLRLLSLQLNPECPYKISINTPELSFITSPTHKLQTTKNHIQCNFQKGTDSQLFLLLFSMLPQLQCTKIQFGAQGYALQHKYCMYLQLPFPTTMYDEMIYYNCEDPRKNQEQETMESMVSFSTLRPEPINRNQWPYFYNLSQLVSRNVIFFLDQSNSMDGTKIILAKQGLQIFIRSLPNQCYLNVYSFGSKWKKIFQQPQKICEPILTKLEQEIEKMEGNMGSTFLLGALQDALKEKCNQDWFIMTDGRIAEIDEIYSLIKANPQIRIFSLGFGMEFDMETVERLANISKGSYAFCQNIQSLNSQMILLLEKSLQPEIKMNIKFNDKMRITTLYPSPNRSDRELFCFLDNQQLGVQAELDVEVEYGFENEQTINQVYHCNLRSIECTHMLHLYCQIQLLEKILSEIWYQDTITTILSNKHDFDVNNPLLLMFFNPLNVLMIDNYAVISNINLQNLLKLVNELKQSRDYLGILLNLISDQTYEQAIRCIKANENISEESTSIEMGSSFTQANQGYLIKVIQTQQLDGSFLEREALELVCPSKSMNAILSKMPDSSPEQSLVNGRQTQQLPGFILTQIWVTALVIAYLKMNQKLQRGQWILIYIKAINFIKQHLKNWQPLLFKARTELINAGLK